MKTNCLTVMIPVFLFGCATGIQAQTVTDADGNVYQTITIGSQVWMRENLKSLHYADSAEILYVWSYNDSDSLAVIYGRLYSWEAAMHGAASSNSIPSGVQGVCPDGWHLPSSAEWSVLTGYYGGEMEAGGKLKEADTTHWYPPNAGATNESGFTALPGGACWETRYELMGNTGFWWTTNNQYDYIDFIAMSNEVAVASIVGTFVLPEDYNKSGYSVRCLQNSGSSQINPVDKPGQISIFPNPAEDRINIEIDNTGEQETVIELVTVTGTVIYRREYRSSQHHFAGQIDVSGYARGMYFVRIWQGGAVYNGKIVLGR